MILVNIGGLINNVRLRIIISEITVGKSQGIVLDSLTSKCIPYKKLVISMRM